MHIIVLIYQNFNVNLGLKIILTLLFSNLLLSQQIFTYKGF
jgi:hypothetical protein